MSPLLSRSLDARMTPTKACNFLFIGGSFVPMIHHAMCLTRRILLTAALAIPLSLPAATSTIVGWNNLGMHCMDSDYSVFSILPPYNTIEAQLIVNGRLVTNGTGYTLTYQAVADPDGSFNSTAMGKGDFYEFARALYGATLAPEAGLAGWAMPGTNNTPQSMLFEPTNHPAPGVATLVNWFRAEGIPIVVPRLTEACGWHPSDPSLMQADLRA